MIERRCENCAFWQHESCPVCESQFQSGVTVFDECYGECRRLPPVMANTAIVNGNDNALNEPDVWWFPTVRAGEWCGCFSASEWAKKHEGKS
jgi:hypothetical protein